MTVKEYLRNNTLSGMAVATEIIQVDKHPVLRVNRTVFHPQGGGQKADHGKIGNATVIHVAHNQAEVDHYLDSSCGIVVGHVYEMQVDPDTRRRNSVHHTTGHLIAGVVEAEFPKLKAVAGHQWPGEARVEFTCESTEFVAEHIRLIVQDKLARCIRSDLVVKVVGDPFTNRSVQIGSFPDISCGGTHVTSLSQIQDINITGVRMKGGKIRVSYEAFAYEYLG